MDIPENLLEFKIANQFFGVDGNKINQIVRVPPITPLPLGNSAQKGVAVLNGKIVSVIDLGLILDISEVDIKKESARLLTMNLKGVEYSFLVDEVTDIISVDKEKYEVVKENNENIIGIYKKREDEICQVLNFDKIIESLFIEEFSPTKLENMSVEEKKKLENNHSNERMLFFKLDEEKFAINISILRELVFVPNSITPIPESDEYVMGMITLRGEVITIIDLRKVFGFKSKEIDEKSRLLIVQIDNKSLALLVDFVEEVKNISLENIEELPEQFKDEKIEGIYKNETEIASIISKLYLKKMTSKYFIEENSVKEKIDNEREEEVIMNEMAVFNIANEEFAIDIQDVQEIIKYEEITPIPEAPKFIKGLINLRGVIIPIVSLPERLGFEEKITDKTKILVCNIKNNLIGLLVDDVNEILFVEDKYVKKSDSEDTLFDEIITLDNGKRVILKIRTRAILDDETFEKIKMMEK